MAPFRFELDALLTKVRRREDEAQRDLAKRLRERMILQAQIHEDQGAISRAKRNLSDALVGSVNLPRVREFAQFSGEMTQRAQSIVVRLAGLERQITQHREVLAVAVRHRKAIELLYQRRHDAWKRRETQRETAEMDEIALQIHQRHREQGAVA